MSEETGQTRQTGLVFQQAHFPGRAPVDSYGNGGFRFADMSHRGSILCLPSGIYGWSANLPTDLTVENFAQVLQEDGLEVLLVGTGTDLVPVSQKLRDALSAKGIACDPMGTGAAARTFNVLLGEGRAVGAALLAVK
ncbi:Mth938-like domain-containing protein [Ahrensia sp. R2A130]|uniref:Mth938-like domain-containing protein n=1 Tax=Ahrensia sp. R2A130 TaxID=744979 RepID=UPI0001E0E06A|nr:Mth938-like domain-containing protein [Ahrensia sp. R2A130]EFL90373.1 outer membrane protein [Ahrensia sp. R2A130]